MIARHSESTTVSLRSIEMSGESKKLEFLYLSHADVVKVGLTVSESVQLVTQSFSEHGKGQVENPPKPGVHPQPDAFIHAMPAYLKESGICGIKWVSGVPANVPKRLPTIAGLIVLNDVTTGLPLAVLDGTYITALRTSAASGLAARHLARPDAQVLGIVGTGVQGKYHTLFLRHVLPSIKTIKLFDSWKPSIESYLKEIKPVLGEGVKVEVMDSIEQVLTGSDVVVTATGKLLEPVFFEKWVKPGALVLPVHCAGWEKDVLTKMDMVVVDDWPQFVSMVESVYTPLPSKDSVPTLGEVVIGRKPGRQSNEQRIINFNVGLAVHDIIVASKVVEKAKQMGLGTTLEFMNLGCPIPLPKLM